MARKRVGSGEAFRAAYAAIVTSFEGTADVSGLGHLIGIPLFGVWWTIFGVPEKVARAVWPERYGPSGDSTD